MNNLYNSQYSKDVLDLFNQTAQLTFSNSLALWEQQIDYVRKNANRNLARAFSLQQVHSPEEVIDLQRKAGEVELAELKKAGADCYELANSASQDFILVAQKGRELMENSFGEATEKAASVFPNGKAAMFSDMVQSSVKTASDFFQNGFDAAVQVTRAGADSVVKGQQAAANVQVIPTGGKRKAKKK